MKILLVEDDSKVTASIQNMSSLQGFNCDVLDNGLDAYNQIRRENYDVIILDIMLPKMNGTDLLEKIRNDGDNTPVLMLTALNSIDNKVKSLDLGADDYMVKPISAKELFARIRALIRRNESLPSQDYISFYDLTYYPYSQKLLIQNENLPLTKREAALLEILIKNSNTTVESDKLIKNIWDKSVSKNNLEILVKKLRTKLELGNSNTRIRNIRKVGYMLEKKPH